MNQRHVLTAPVPPLSVSGRDALVRAELAKRGAADALVVFDLNNIRWLTGFTGSAGTLIVRNDEMVLVTDGRYGEQARFQLATSGAAARVFEARSAAALREGVEQSLTNATHVAVDPNEVTQAQFETLRTQTTATMVPTVGVVQHLRRRKTEAEIARMRRAA
ncbi:MAG: aminopeptidase P family N-terminal domain-containing protein, partial [Ilumatobacteraceae bacterium]